MIGEASPPAKNGGAVVLADDEEIMRRTLAMALRRRGFQVVEAGSGDEVLATLGTSEHVSIVVADYGMPGAESNVIALAVEQRVPPVKVLFTSGYSEHTLREQGRLVEGRPFLGKPFTIRELVQAIETVLASSAGAQHGAASSLSSTSRTLRMSSEGA
jgi:two-component system cell cycle sensor histidine kinase/response regulator CckA